jgi:uncharacterized protein
MSTIPPDRSPDDPDIHRILDELREKLSDRDEWDPATAERLQQLHHQTARYQGEVQEDRAHWRRIMRWCLIVFASMLLGHFILSFIPLRDLWNGTLEWSQTLDEDFLWLVLAGFCAQLVDGALGMGYGIVSASFLLSLGVNFAAISGSIHTAEMFSSGVSGYSHYRFGNVDRKLFRRLVIPGVIGAIGGALALVYFGEKYAHWVKPVLAAYILFLGIKYILLAFRNTHLLKEVKHVGRLAGAGGFLDSFGGGGWGPLVTTTLLRTSHEPRRIIGSVSLTEFFVTLASAFTFFTLIGISHWQAILGLVIGGLVAAPVAAKLAGKLNRRTSFLLIGILASLWSFRILYHTFWS